jgi:uncharacterized protein (DUF924 family)
MSLADAASTSGPAEPAWVAEVLHFWFEQVGEAHWFDATAELDAQIRARFLALHRQVSADPTPAVSAPRALLAAIIVLDQFSRNLFRGTPSAYAADPQARQLANAVIDAGYDLGMTVEHRQFVYLPFQHSEDRADQARSVALFAKLGDAALNKYALAHQSIVERFGRFPHRNAILGRHSSPAEAASLNEPMGAF